MPLPTGECSCECAEDAKRGAFFAPGDDKRAEAAVVKVVNDSVPQFLLAHGFGPGEKSASHALDEYQNKGGAVLVGPPQLFDPDDRSSPRAGSGRASPLPESRSIHHVSCRLTSRKLALRRSRGVEERPAARSQMRLWAYTDGTHTSGGTVSGRPIHSNLRAGIVAPRLERLAVRRTVH